MNLNITRLSSPAAGTTPARRTAAPADISFSSGKSTLGTVLVARSVDGICAILLGASVGGLKRNLAAQFPKHRLIRNDAKLHDDLQKVLRFIETPLGSR